MVIFDSTRPNVKAARKPFGRGILPARPARFVPSDADRAWAAYELNKRRDRLRGHRARPRLGSRGGRVRGHRPDGRRSTPVLRFAGGLGSDPGPLSLSPRGRMRTKSMATQSKPTRRRESKPTARPSKPRPGPVDEVLEDDPTDPDNGDPAHWPEWTNRHAYTLRRR